jgi:cystathionine gamma-lyase
MASQPHRFGTRAIHAGQQPDPATGAIMTPIFQTSTYVQEAPGEHRGHEYARVSNPTRSALEANLAALEGAEHGVCFASGIAATDAVLRKLRPGARIVATNDLYGGTYRLMRQVLEPFGIRSTFIDMTDLDSVEATLAEGADLVWIETPTNPLLRIVDIEAVAQRAKGVGAVTAVDNTFASPYLQQPLALGAELVVHSTTKYIGGHSDLVGGVVLTNDAEWAEHLRFQVKAVGGVPGPMDCFLLLRSSKTLHVRMQRHCENGAAVARFLLDHPKIAEVRYPGFPHHEGHAIARRQMKDFGGMVSLALRDDAMETAVRMMQNLRLFSLAESLGGVESLIGHPASMTHGSIPAEERQRAGLSDSLLRLSVGIEDIEDLLEDLERALESV